MQEDDRLDIVKDSLFTYLNTRSPRQIRDHFEVVQLAKDIMWKLDRTSSIWRKWEGKREDLAKAAVLCWVPVDDFRDYLNDMPGPKLTSTDVAQRVRALSEDGYPGYPNDDLQAGCLELYEREKAEGTELPAIIGALQEHVEREEERRRREHEAAWRKATHEARIALEQRFLAGADCKWTPLQKSAELYCRKNGRTYRLSPTKDKMWQLHRIEEVEDEGGLVGTYRTRGDANKVVAKAAYLPEPRW